MRKARVLDFSLFFVAVLLLQSSFAQDSTRWGLPERAKMRIGKARIAEIAYSPDGSRIAAATHKDIWMYDAHSGAALKLLSGHTDLVLTVAFSPSGNTLASGGADGTVRGWDVRSGTLFETITGHGESVRSVQFSPDGSTLASAGEDKTYPFMGCVERRSSSKTLEGHSESVDTVAFSPDGLTIASGSRDGALMLWDVQTGEKIHRLEGHEQPVSSVAFSPDGLTLASAGRPNSVSSDLTRNGRIKLWNTRTGEQVRTLEGHSHTVGCVAFSPDGLTLASVRRLVRRHNSNVEYPHRRGGSNPGRAHGGSPLNSFLARWGQAGKREPLLDSAVGYPHRGASTYAGALVLGICILTRRKDPCRWQRGGYRDLGCPLRGEVENPSRTYGQCPRVFA